MKNKKEEKLGKIRDIIKDHIENSKVIDTIKEQISKGKNLTIHDKNTILKKLKSEGVLSHLLHSIPVSKIAPDRKVVAGIGVKRAAGIDLVNKDLLDPKKKYLI